MTIPKLPLADWIDVLVNWLKVHMAPLFTVISKVISSIIGTFEWVFELAPAPVMILLFTALAFWLSRWTISLFT